jgi:ATP-binding cassette subfamily F protein uup
VTEYVGGYEDFLRQSRGAGSGVRESGLGAQDSGSGSKFPFRPKAEATSTGSAVREATRSTTPQGRKENARLPKKLSFKEKKEFESLPAHIEALEAEQARLQRESALPAFYKESAEHIKGVLARIDAIAKDLETVLARWVELDERS